MFQSIIKGAIVVAMIAAAVSCRPRTDFPEAGGDYNTRDAVIGTWRVNKVIQNDEGAISKNFPDKAKYLDLTPLFPELAQTTITLSGGADSTFKVNAADSLNAMYLPLGDGFKWTFVDPTNGPRYIQVYKKDNGVITARYRVDFGQPYRKAENKLSLRFARRNTDGVAYVSYDYNMTR